ncbi:hypothetical protein [Pseudomonas typographi]|uniref:hypothetical protein n=1 Tax=Pseudomonas typographi TaxID=2715964 RepID=UPI001683A3EE|nr:hypothetical protein [Pseudomonas typographi]MBD1552910.1 hypothetical protein [Pseudomonas typographi]MBD1588285.1 hypothetical protein [Pseudomonas typographi]
MPNVSISTSPVRQNAVAGSFNVQEQAPTSGLWANFFQGAKNIFTCRSGNARLHDELAKATQRNATVCEKLQAVKNRINTNEQLLAHIQQLPVGDGLNNAALQKAVSEYGYIGRNINTFDSKSEWLSELKLDREKLLGKKVTLAAKYEKVQQKLRRINSQLDARP